MLDLLQDFVILLKLGNTVPRPDHDCKVLCKFSALELGAFKDLCVDLGLLELGVVEDLGGEVLGAVEFLDFWVVDFFLFAF